MQKLDKRDVIIRKVEEMKRGGYKATAIKVELEANFDREYSDWPCSACYDFIMEQLEPFGLARKGDEHYVGHDDEYETEWHTAGPLVYADFYNDGSVDSEFTFTILLDKAENVFLIPRVIEAFKALGREIGSGIDVDRAGMHMAILNDKNGLYPVECSPTNMRRFENFQRSLTLLLPALYFLGSGSSSSRALEYRQPRVACPTSRTNGNGGFYDNPKYSAIFYSGGALEYRLFETCYDNPDIILDNIVVIANTLRYWRKQYRPSGLSTIANNVKFGVPNGRDLDRFYRTANHLDLLNAGLRKLKPAYYTIRQVKEQRLFKTDKRKLNAKVRECTTQALKQYTEYVANRKWEAHMYLKKVETEVLERYYYDNSGHLSGVTDMETALQELLEKAKIHFKEHYNFDPDPAESFVANYVLQHTGSEGNFTLRETAPPAPETRTAAQMVEEVVTRWTATVNGEEVF